MPWNAAAASGPGSAAAMSVAHTRTPSPALASIAYPTHDAKTGIPHMHLCPKHAGDDICPHGARTPYPVLCQNLFWIVTATRLI